MADKPNSTGALRLSISVIAAFSVLAGESAENEPPTLRAELVAEGFSHPLALAEAPGDPDRLFVADQTGQIWIIGADGTRLERPFLDLSDRLVDLKEHYDERGLLGFTFDPMYRENGRFFVFYSAPLRETANDSFDHTNRVSEFSTLNLNTADPASEKVLLEIDHPYTNHNAGTLTFGPDNFLYVSLGDGGHRDDQDTGLVPGHVDDWYARNDGGNGQDIENNLLGSILRIDVSGSKQGHHGQQRPYGIPDDNPFTEIPGVLPEYYAYGFRNPYRFSFDRADGNTLIVGDAGQNMFEEISLVRKGGNYGWNVLEGNHCFNAASPLHPFAECPQHTGERHPLAGDPLIPPVIEFRNASTFPQQGLGLVVVGGFVNRGTALPAWFNGKYLFGVWSGGERHTGDGEVHLPGRVFAATMTRQGTWPFQEVRFEGRPGLDQFLLSFGQDGDGNLYLLTSSDVSPHGNSGKVLRLMAATPQGRSSP